MTRALRQHWPEYFMEAACLGMFMISAGLFTALLEYPNSPVRHVIPNDFVRLALNGLAMGLTAMGIIYSPWGARSGAHMNPAVTWTFFRLRRMKPWDAVFYPIFQTLGGVAGVLLVKFGLGRIFTDAPVRYVVTVPGKGGVATAFVAEMAIACGMMLMVLLLDYFFRMHDPTTLNRQHNDVGTQYRSAIFYTSEAQKQTAERVLRDQSGKFKRPITTEITAATKFYSAEDYHQKYLVKNPGCYTCHVLRD